MTRYVMAGLAMTASVVLLFIASFRTPVPGADRAGLPAATQVLETEGASSGTADAGPVSDGRDSTEAVAVLQEQIRRASQTIASLESEVTRTRQDLASLQSQKAQGAPSQISDASPPAQGATAVQRGGASLPPGVAIDPATAGRVDLNDKRRPVSNAGQAPASADAGGQQPATPRPRVADPRPSPVATSSDARSARASLPDGRIADDDATQAALSKLRRQSAQPVPVPVRPDGAGEPHRVPTIERLADARAAVIDGRMDDARRYLQAAQVQLVFRAVGPGNEQPRVSQATGPISQALLALSTGDRGRAVIAIDQAAGALDTTARSRQFGSLPTGESMLLPPVPRLSP